MTLGTLIDGLPGARLIGDANVAVRAVQSDSRMIEPGDVYVAIRGIRADGHAFVPAASVNSIDRSPVPPHCAMAKPATPPSTASNVLSVIN